jgi:hypothetical protein
MKVFIDLAVIALLAATTAHAWAQQVDSPPGAPPTSAESGGIIEAVPDPAAPLPKEEPVVESPSDIPVPPPQERVVEESPSDVPLPLEPDLLDALDKLYEEDGAKDVCDGGCTGRGICLLGCCTSPPCKLPQPCLLQSLGISMGGWLQQGITFNSKQPADHFNGPVATNDLDSHYQMNQLWLFFDRPADTGGCGWAIGGHIDLLYGTDWRFGVNHGLEDRINSFSNQYYGMVIPQAYVEVAYNNLSVKLGHFAAILDYEVIPAPPNPFYSHSYGYGYGVPQLVTGALGNYRVNNQLSLQAGFHRGWFMFEDYDGNLDFMGGFKWQSCDERTSLAYAVSTGRQSFRPVVPLSDQNRFVYSLVFQHRLSERLRYVLVQNLGVENFTGGLPDEEWYGINQYLLYTINPCLAANLRVEWLRDDDGLRVLGPGNIPGIRAWTGRGFAGNFYALTCGLNWRPHPNWLLRPEVRWDWYDGPDGQLGAPGTQPVMGQPFDAGDSDDQFTFAMDAVLTF